MKKIKYISFLILLSIFSTNQTNAVSKKNLEYLQSLTTLFAAADIITDHVFTEYKYWPSLAFNVPKPEKLQFYPSKDSHFAAYGPAHLNNILYSALEQNEDFLSILVNGYVRSQNLKQALESNTGTTISTKEIGKEGLVIAAEKICESIANNLLNNTIKETSLRKRLLKVLLFTAIGAGGAYLRKELADPELKEKMPELASTAVDKFIETLFCEIAASFIQNYLLDNPNKENLEFITKKHQEILDSKIPTLVKLHKTKQQKAKPEELAIDSIDFDSNDNEEIYYLVYSPE
jgi:hypothetical protein